MPQRSAFLAVLLAALAAPTLQGCVVAAAGAGASAGYTLSQQRSMAQQVKDTALAAAVGAAWRQYEPKLYENCSVMVYDGDVLITGRVPNQQWRDIADKLAWRQQGVRKVYDEIQVGPGEGFGRSAQDGLLTARLKAALLGDGAVRSVNYEVTTTEGVVYIMGSARSQAELNAVMNHARALDGVRRVVSFVRLRSSAPPQNTAPAPPPPPSSGPAALQSPPPAQPPPEPVQAIPLK